MDKHQVPRWWSIGMYTHIKSFPLVKLWHAHTHTHQVPIGEALERTQMFLGLKTAQSVWLTVTHGMQHQCWWGSYMSSRISQISTCTKLRGHWTPPSIIPTAHPTVMRGRTSSNVSNRTASLSWMRSSSQAQHPEEKSSTALIRWSPSFSSSVTHHSTMTASCYGGQRRHLEGLTAWPHDVTASSHQGRWMTQTTTDCEQYWNHHIWKCLDIRWWKNGSACIQRQRN